MEKFIQPRGTGRTYNICKYAITHNCDIVSPTTQAANFCMLTIEKLCNLSNKKYILCKMDQSTGTILIFRNKEEDLIKIQCFGVKEYIRHYNGLYKDLPSIYIPQRREFVVDDIDQCMQILFSDRIRACSIESYDPADVALKKESNE